MNPTLKSTLVAAAASVAMASFVGGANANLVLTIAGDPGSSSFSITGSGSNTVTSSVDEITTAFLRVPTESAWENPFESTFGDILNGTPTYLDLISSSGAVGLSVTGSTTYSRLQNGLRLLSGAPDHFALTTTSSELPDLVAGDTVSFFGTAVFTLPSGTFGSLWNAGTYLVSPAADGGTYTVVVQGVPEPSTDALLAIGLIGLLSYRARRRQA